jgi:16S rRNA (cytidine1402-2'-O)-methyltransferase
MQQSWAPGQASAEQEEHGGPGTLHVVATPIGNLEDLSPRARATLATVQLVAAEDTRHTGQLLTRLGIRAPLLSLHEHNEAGRVEQVLSLLRGGQHVALVSDAGTPLISDPGYRLVAAVAAAGLPITALPGPSAVLAALQVAGLPTDRFFFEGFLPQREGPRRARLAELRDRGETLVFFTGIHRLVASLRDMAATLGEERPVVVARELTKLHETIYRGTLAELAARLADDADASRGEVVIVVGGAPVVAADHAAALRIARLLAEELPAAQAAALAARITGLGRRDIYRALLAKEVTDGKPGDPGPPH